MAREARASIQFTLNGCRYQLSHGDVEISLADVAPDAIRTHAVRVNDAWFPVIQPFEVATGIPRSEFTSNTARRHLAALGYELAGNVNSRTGLGVHPAFKSPDAAPRSSHNLESLMGEWHTEANVQAALVTALAAGRWRILSVANTATKEHGVDVIASRDSQNCWHRG